MDLSSTEQLVAIIGGALTAATFLVAGARWAWPRWKRLKADAVGTRDAILGRDAVRDSITGREIQPALPGVGVRMDRVEQAIAQLADQHAVLENHEQRIKALEDATVERVVTKAESAQMWRAIANDREDDADPPTI